MARGAFTEELGTKYNVTLKELRLIPYVQYSLLNHTPIDIMRVDEEELEILKKWKSEGKIHAVEGNKLACTKEFWDWMNDVLWESYVPRI